VNMENTHLSSAPPAEEKGKWVPVDPETLGFKLNGAPNQEIVGPDGNKYRIGEPKLSAVGSNAYNAIPTPSTIVQMPPIVQPIALVPYTSQNQPLLQYDPYSRPVVPPVQPRQPDFVKKPYVGVSAVAFILSLATAFVGIFISFAVFKAMGARPNFNVGGYDALMSLFAAAGYGSSQYYTLRLAASGDALSKMIAYALPVIIVLIILIFLILAIKYIVRIGKKRTPRGFSFGAFLNVILTLSAAGILLGMSNAEAAIDSRSANVAAFFKLQSTINMGLGLIVSFAVSVILLILPYFAKKNAFVEKE